MIIPSQSHKLHDEVLEQIAKALDISPAAHEEASSKFRSLGAWLERSASTLTAYEPEISPQGSFLLGTVIKPLTDQDEYDIDLICRLRAGKDEFTQKELKEAVGKEVIAYSAAQNMKNAPEEKRRCWMLPYVKGTQFHLDVVPSIPDTENYRMQLRDSGYYALASDDAIIEKAIAITDWFDPAYEIKSEDWPSSNPLGYGEWFKRRMTLDFDRRRQILFDSRQIIVAKVQDVPAHRVKTTLQQVIQLLKRHRDVMFQDDLDEKPISIIITTLAAHAYNNESSLSQALDDVLTKMENFIEDRAGVKWVSNPVNPKENFADKWQEVPEKQHNFYHWLRKAKRDFAAYLRASASHEMPSSLRDALGEKYVEPAVASVHPNRNASVQPDQKKERVMASVASVASVRSGTKPWAK